MSATSAETIRVTDTAWECIQGAYDTHLHVAPDVIERRIDDLDLADEFKARGLKGFVLKSHYAPTYERAAVVRKARPGIEVFGSITLNHAVGGLNPVALEIAGRSGCKTVWMPTVDAANETAGRANGPNVKLPFWAKIQRELAATGICPPPITVLGEDGELTAQTRECLELIGKHDMVLATAHLSKKEIRRLVKTGKAMGLKKIIVTHAEFPSQNMTADEQLEVADMGAIVEHCFTTAYTGKAPWEVLLANVRKVGPERCVISTDLGQTINPPISEGFAMFAQKFLDAGFTPAEVKRMAVQNSTELMS